MFRSLTRRPLYVNIIVGLLILAAVIISLILSLNFITRHGESRNVPSLVGKNMKEVNSILEEKGFSMVIQDSVFYDSLPPGIVIKQVPDPDDVVKVNRTVYVTVNRFVAPDIDMPNLIGFSFRNAEMILKNMGLHIGDTTYKPDFAKNSVLDQLLNGESLKAGQKVKVGSKISLVLGSGIGTENILVPSLKGMTYEEAKTLLDAQGLILGALVPDPDVRDTLSAFVKEQRPGPKTEDGRRYRIKPGQMIDLFLSVKPPLPDSLINKTPVQPQQPQ